MHSPSPQSAAPISGTLELCETQFDFAMSVERIYETPRVTKPYTEEQWHRIESLGHAIDVHLEKGDVRLTMGGEPTFVSIDDMEGEEWKTAALGPTKRHLANQLFQRLQQRFADGGLPHYGQGKMVSWRTTSSLGSCAATGERWSTDLARPAVVRRR
ncbi:MAG: transglutaminase family protein [Pirellulaceae bacterium]